MRQAERREKHRTGAGGGQAPAIRLRLLGGFGATLDAETVPEDVWRLRKAKSLVKLLALAPGHTLHREAIGDLLWPDLDPAAADNNLRQALLVARRALSGGRATTPPALQLRDEQIRLAPAGGLWVDVAAFEAATAAARRAAAPVAYEAALALYTGDLLPEDRYEDWAAGRREVLREVALGLLADLAALHEAHGEVAATLVALERLTALEPAHEAAQARLMRLRASRGDRSGALRQYARLREALRRELDAEPGPATRRLYAAILAGGAVADQEPAAPPMPGGAGRRRALPTALTRFIGREREVAALGAQLADGAGPRLVTLVGAGGVGKTRLALAVARTLEAGRAFPGGVWLVELAALEDAGLVPGALGRALGVREVPGYPLLDGVTDRLTPGPTLLLLDNCEHLLEGCAAVATRLLGACPALRILATSREALRVTGELVWRVPSLGLPAGRGDRCAAVDGVARSEAGQLFLDRGRLVRPDFTLTDGNAAAVAAICARLDGLPLALELAAARLAHLPVEQIAARLDDALCLLTGGDRAAVPRQRTLRATLDWSHATLAPQERVLLRRLAPFAGGFDLAAAEAVGAGSDIAAGAILELLAALVDKSLAVAAAAGDEARYRLLEPLRQYAAEQLRAAGEGETVGARHAAHYLALAEEAEPHLVGRAQVAWLARLEREHDNLRAALRWAVARGEATCAGRLCAALAPFWQVHGHLAEGAGWLAGALARAADPAVPTALRARLLQGAGTLAWAQGEQRRALALTEEAHTWFRELDDQGGIAATLHNLGRLAERSGDFLRARALYEAGLGLRRALADESGTAATLQVLGNVARHAGERERAAAYYEESLALQRRAGGALGAAMALGSLGHLAHDAGDLPRAAARYSDALVLFREVGDTANVANTLNNLGLVEGARGAFEAGAAWQAEALRLVLEIGDRRGAAFALEGLGATAALQGHGRRTAHFFGMAERLREELGIPITPTARPDYEGLVARGRSAVGAAAFAAAWREGRERDLAAALAEALAAPAAASGTPARESPPLSLRESEVAALIAHGRTNRQIASELGMSQRTADTHVGRILRKLGVASRAEVAARLGHAEATGTGA